MFSDDDSTDRKAFSPLALRTGTDDRNEREREREREMIGLRYGQKDLAGMSDGQKGLGFQKTGSDTMKNF